MATLPQDGGTSVAPVINSPLKDKVIRGVSLNKQSGDLLFGVNSKIPSIVLAPLLV